MPARADTPRDLMFGLLALQTGLIDQSALLIAFHAWTRAGGRPMAELLLEQRVINNDQRSLLEALAAQHLKKHGSDPEKSLAAFPVSLSTKIKLEEMTDPDLDASIKSVVSTLATEDDPYATVYHSAGSATSGSQRFKVLRPHARGALGAVFVALDTELNREVALKEILEKHADDPSYQAKFVLEAEITGNLEHPGIVPVYGLGYHDDGRPYYAMRFIQGDNLKQAIERFHGDEKFKSDPGARSLALRKLLRRFTDVCNAIEYAHSRGVLHRDIKPGNIIVGKHGETLVVDWGLAKAQGRSGSDSAEGERSLIPSLSSGSSETLPGQAIGTPAFMSPEQADGDLAKLGPRSDVYSLGATLYSLLTGRLPFEGSIRDILNNVREGRFLRPRAVDPTIDPALEALCLMAMAKLPEARYPSPRALAEEIDRWAADQPVTAWREPFSRRLRRWSRTHRTAVTAIGVALVASLIGLAGFLAIRTQARRELLETRNAFLQESNRLEKKNVEELTQANARVQSRFQLAQDAIQSLKTTVLQDAILKDERFRSLRDRLLQSAADFYDKQAKLIEAGEDPGSRILLADSYEDLANLSAEIGDLSKALLSYQKALSLRRQSESSENPAGSLDLAQRLLTTGVLYSQNGDHVSALRSFNEAIERLQSRKWPGSTDVPARLILAEAIYNIGYQKSELSVPVEALEAFRRSLELEEALVDSLAGETQLNHLAKIMKIHNDRGAMNERLGKFDESMQSYRRALEIAGDLTRRRTLATDDELVARIHSNLGILYQRQGDSENSRKSYAEALKIQEHLAAENPAFTKYQVDLALSLNNLSNVLERTGDLQGSILGYERALKIQEDLANRNPTVVRFRSDLAVMQQSVGLIFERRGDRNKAWEFYERVREIRERLVRENPQIPDYRADLAQSYHFLGVTKAGLGDPAGGLDLQRRSIALLVGLVAGYPDTAKYRAELAKSYHHAGLAHELTDGFDRALEAYEQALAIRQSLVDQNPEAIDDAMNLATTCNNIGTVRLKQNQIDQAAEWFARSSRMVEKVVELDPRDHSHVSALASSKNNLGNLALSKRDYPKSLTYFRESVAIREKLVADHPSLISYRDDLGDNYNNLAFLLSTTNRGAEAYEMIVKALAIRQSLVDENPTVVEYRAKLFNGLFGAVAITESLKKTDALIGYLKQSVAVGQQLPRSPTTLFNIGLMQAQLALVATSPLSGMTRTQAEEEQSRAVALLKVASEAGYRDLNLLRTNRVLNVLRKRPDFQLLLLDQAFPDRPFAR